jgi:hypothetical protein
MKRRSKKRSVYDEQIIMFLFLAFLVAVLFIIDAIYTSEETVMTEQVLKKLIINDPSEEGIGFIVKERVDEEKLLTFANMDYEEIKDELGVDYDFTVYFEDEKGNLVTIGDKYCIGSPKAKIAGVSCG